MAKLKLNDVIDHTIKVKITAIGPTGEDGKADVNLIPVDNAQHINARIDLGSDEAPVEGGVSA